MSLKLTFNKIFISTHIASPSNHIQELVKVTASAFASHIVMITTAGEN